MTVNSRYGGAVKWSSTQIGTSRPVDTGLVADCLVNNAQHFVDEETQPLANWCSPSSGTYFAPDTISTVTPQLTAVIGPFPVKLLPSGLAPLVIVSLAAACSTAGGSCVFFCTLREHGLPTLDRAPSTTTQYSDNLVTSTNAIAWLSGILGLRMTPEQVSAARARIGTKRSAAGTPVQVDTFLAQLEIRTLSDSASREPRLFGWHVREYNKAA